MALCYSGLLRQGPPLPGQSPAAASLASSCSCRRNTHHSAARLVNFPAAAGVFFHVCANVLLVLIQRKSVLIVKVIGLARNIPDCDLVGKLLKSGWIFFPFLNDKIKRTG